MCNEIEYNLPYLISCSWNDVTYLSLHFEKKAIQLFQLVCSHPMTKKDNEENTSTHYL